MNLLQSILLFSHCFHAKRYPMLRYWWLAAGLGALFLGCTPQAAQKKENTMAKEATQGTAITLKGETVHTTGHLPAVGREAPDFTLTAEDLSAKTLKDFKGKNIILNIFISVNTGVCSKSVRTFNEKAADMKNTVVLCISKDLPFAQKQFCGAEGIDNVVMLSDFRTDFGTRYGVLLTDGPMRGLLSRAVVVINAEGKVVYTEQVPEISQEPNYAAALAALPAS